jgi:CRP-like cAMP-binding protein
MSSVTTAPRGTLRSIIGALRQDGEEAPALALHSGAALRARQGQEVFAQGDPSDAVYLLIAGEVSLSVSVEEQDVAERTTALLRAPALLGDRDLIAQAPALEGARCLTAARLLVFPEAAFWAEWNSDAALARALSEDLARRMASSLLLRRLDAFALPRKLAALVSALNLASGALPDHGYLAAITNATPKSVGRALLQSQDAPAPTDEELLPLIQRRLFHSLSVERFRAESTVER